MSAPFASQESRIAAGTFAMLANCTVTLGEGEPFGAELDIADELAFDRVTAGSHVLTYPSAHAIADGAVITIDGAQWKVVAPPRRQGAHVCIAEVIEL